MHNDDEEIDSMNNQLTIAYIKYLKANNSLTYINKSALAREINALYLQLAVMAVAKGVEDMYQISEDITDLVRSGTFTMQKIPDMVQPFSEPVVEMYFDESLIEEALNQKSCGINWDTVLPLLFVANQSEGDTRQLMINY